MVVFGAPGFVGVLRACACNRYQAAFPPPLRGLGMRLVHYVFIGDSSVLCPVKFGRVLFKIFAFEFCLFFIPIYFTCKKWCTQFIK